MEVDAQAKAIASAQFMHKNRLQEFIQKSRLPLPEYRTVNEGDVHAPRFRATVVVDGMTFTSPHVFPQRKAAEQDVAKIAFESVWRKIETEGFSLIQEDVMFCKSILHEYAVKMNMERPTYMTSQVEGNFPAFISSSFFNGETYTGVPANNKKEAEQFAARAVIESILANSNTRAVMGEIIRPKRKLHDASSKVRIPSSFSSERNVCLWGHTQDNPNDAVNGKHVLADSANNKLHASISLGDVQIAEAATTESFTPEAEKAKEGCAHELRGGPNGNGSPHPTCAQAGLLATMSSSITSSDGSLALDGINDYVKQIDLSTRSENSQAGILTSGMKRSDTTQNGGNESKKARTIEQPPDSPEKDDDDAAGKNLPSLGCSPLSPKKPEGEPKDIN